MLDKLLPEQVTRYSGHPLAKWVFVALTVITIGRSLVHMFAADGGAQSIATIPLDAYSTAAADTVIFLFALWGLSQLIIGLLYGVVLWRYQGLIPLMYLLMIFEYAMRIVLGNLKPIVTTTTAPGAIGDYILVPLALVMLILSLRTGPQSHRTENLRTETAG